MKLNMKKVLLTGTALVAVAGFGASAQAATTVINGADAAVAADPAATPAIRFETDNTASVNDGINVTGTVVTNATNTGVLEFLGDSTLTGNVGATGAVLKSITTAAAVKTVTLNGNVFATAATVGAGSTLTLTKNATIGTTTVGAAGVLQLNGGVGSDNAGNIAKRQEITGNIAGTGILNVGTTGGNAVKANAAVNGTIDAATVDVRSGSTLTINNNVTTTANFNSDGTLRAVGVNSVVITPANLDVDGTFVSNLSDNRTTTLKGAAVARTLDLAAAGTRNFGSDVSPTANAALTTTVTTSNQINTAGTTTFGAVNGTGVNTVVFEIGRNDFWNATNDVGTTITALRFTGGNFQNDGIFRVRVADTNSYGFENGDLIHVVAGSAGGTNIENAMTLASTAAGAVVLENSALVRLDARDAAGAWLAADANNLTVRVVHNNPHGILASGYAADAAAHMMNHLTEANYGARWGEKNEVTAAVAGDGRGLLGAIQGNADNLANGNVLREARNNLLTARTAAAATDVAESLTTTVDGGHVMGALNATNGTFSVANDRLASLRSGSTGMAAGNGAGHRFWLQGFGASADQDTRSGVKGYDADTWGFSVGLDTETLHQNGTLGIAFSYGDTEVDSKNANRTNSEIDTYQVTLYGDYDLDQSTFLTGMLAYSWHDVDTTRHNVGGIAGIHARGDFDAHQWTAEASVGRDYQYDTMTLTPNLLAHYTHYSADNYTETGAGNASLHVDQDSLSKFELGVGVNAAWNFQTASGANLEPSLHAGYRYDFIGDEVETTNRFVGGGAAFKAEGADPSKHSFNVGGALSLYSHSGWEFTANYDYDFKSDYDAHSGFLRAGVKF